jgi:acetoin utilization protein AcuC
MDAALYRGDALAAYAFDEKPWFRSDRLPAFLAEVARRGLDHRVRILQAPPASDEDLLLFHTRAHLDRVRALCARNEGALDHGPTPARAAVERAATHVAGAVTDAVRRILGGEIRRAFVPIAGFHHARPEEPRLYCLYNDPAIALSLLLSRDVAPAAYIDVDAHFGDGVFDAFAGDPRVVVADFHEEGRTLFPFSPDSPGEGRFPGDRADRGEGEAAGTKLNVPLAAGTGDEAFLAAWTEAEAFLDRFAPRFVVFESGADCLAGDPLCHLRVSPRGLGEITARVRAFAERHAEGRLLVLGGGGYTTDNVARGWAEVLAALV